MDRRRLLVGLGTVSTVAIAGCSDDGDPEQEEDPDDGQADTDTGDDDQPDDDSTDESQEDGDQDDTDSAAIAVEDQHFEGSGVDLIPDVQTASGLAITEATHNGSEDFVVELLGDYSPDRLILEEGAVDGGWATSVSVIPGDDVRELEVTADGDWEISLRHPRPESGEELPATVNGDGRGVYGPFEFTGGHTIDATHDGESNFIVEVFPVTDDPQEVVINTLGEYNDQESFTFLDVGYIQVTADGEWTLDVE